ncbi:hypothetical protein Tco_1387403, partial [Tanacetum coccineum]
SAAAGSVCLSAPSLPARPAPAESTQQSSHLSRPQSADPAQLEHQPAPICLQHEPSRTLSPVPVPQQQRPSGLGNTSCYLCITHLDNFLHQLPMPVLQVTQAGTQVLDH